MSQFFHDAVTVLSAKEWIAYILIVGSVFVFIWMMMDAETREVNHEYRKQKVCPRRRKGERPSGK